MFYKKTPIAKTSLNKSYSETFTNLNKYKKFNKKQEENDISTQLSTDISEIQQMNTMNMILTTIMKIH